MIHLTVYFYIKIKEKINDNNCKIHKINKKLIPLKQNEDINEVKKLKDNIKNTPNITQNIQIIKNIDNNIEIRIQNIDLFKEVIIGNIKLKQNLNNFIEYLNIINLKQSKCFQKLIDILLDELRNLGKKIIIENNYDKNKKIRNIKII